jgi:hypothetical protein
MSCHHTTPFFLNSLTPGDSCALVFWANSCCVTCARNAQGCSSARDRTCIHSAGACCQHSWKAHKYWEGNIQRSIHSYQFIVNARKWNLNVNWSKRASILFSIIFVKCIRSYCENGKECEGFNSYQCFSFVTCNFQHTQISFHGTTQLDLQKKFIENASFLFKHNCKYRTHIGIWEHKVPSLQYLP